MSLLDFELDELKTLLTDAGYEKYRAKQVYSWLQEGVPAERMTNISSSLRDFISGYGEGYIKTVRQLESSDGTVKFVSGLSDGNIIESVLMKKRYGNTVCLSTQAGCRMGCAFCASCKKGLARNLTAGEILAQYISLNSFLGKGRNITNIVLMGMGEPLDNYDSTVKFLKIINNPETFGLSLRNISLSTCGLADRITDFADENLPVTLCISLHAADDEKRKKIMPVTRRWNLESVMDAVRNYFDRTGRRIIFEYAMIKDFNDTPGDIDSLVSLLSGTNCHVNLIPLNSIEGSPFRPTPKKDVYRFASSLEKRGISATVRLSLGSDIMGACGQLRGAVLEGKI